MELSQRVAVITGASQGLGLALAHALARRGVAVALVARHPEPLEHAVASIRAAGGTALAIVADVGEPQAALRIAAQVQASLGRPSIVVHNASTLGPVPLQLLADTDPAAVTQALAVNVVGPFALTRALLGALVLGDGGVVVHISSDASVEAYPTWGAYSIGKAALDHLTRIWAAELADTAVRVFAVDPGEMDTKMHADAMPDADRATLADPAEVAERIVAMITDERAAPSGARVVASRGAVAA
ncbi:MAG TPA: SDR family oxidoreductase [Nannocystaceae bacterium]|nr:SDR family oxidoreductase [Nannocystaceae bacterium]